MSPREQHRSHRIGWLRAAVLGANDGIVSTASLIVGVTAAASSRQEVLVAGMAGLVAGVWARWRWRSLRASATCSARRSADAAALEAASLHSSSA